MENASKALLMAATVLVGVMIISVGVALFSSFSEFGTDTIEKMEQAKIDEWNNTYLKYYGVNTITTIENGKEVDITTPIKVTAHDIVSVANNARQNNINYELENQNNYDENIYYVQVQVGKEKNFEKKTEKQKNEFLQQNALIIDKTTGETEKKYYICTEVKTSSVTKRVMYICFEEYNK